jgi:hypothetical protein
VKSQRTYLYYALALLIPIVLVRLFSLSCLQSEAAGELCVSWMQPFIQSLLPLHQRLGDHPKFLYNSQFPWYGGSLVLLGGLAFARRQFRSSVFWFLAVLPVLGEWASLIGEPRYALIFHLSGLFLISLFWLLSRGIDTRADEVPRLRYWEIGVFSVLAFFVTSLRFYALNRIPWNWDTELCNFRLFASSFPHIWGHESGWAPQTSTGFSYLIINRLIGHFDEPDLYYLYHRMVGCLLSLLKVSVLFLFLRLHVGRFAAFFGASILSFGPPEDWWARVPNFHHWPGILTVLVVWASINAMERKTWSSFILLSLLSATTRFVYPSGMFMVGVPLTFFGSLLLFRWSEWKSHTGKIAVLLVGVVIWVEWLSVCRALLLGRWEALPPLFIPSHSDMPGGIFNKVWHIVVENGADLFSNLYYKQVISTHWTVALTPAPWKSMPSVVAILSVVAAARMIGQRRDAISWLLLISLAFCALPGISSSVADRRIGCMFVLLIIIASREAAWLANFMRRTTGDGPVRVLEISTPIALGAYLALLSSLILFSNPPGIPRQVAIGKVFQNHIKDDWLLVDLSGQMQCDTFMSVSRTLKERDCRAAFTSAKFEGEHQALKMIEQPRFDKREWWYADPRLSELSKCVDWPTRAWKGVTYVITNTPEAATYVAKLRERYPQGEMRTVPASYLAHESEPVIVFEVAL